MIEGLSELLETSGEPGLNELRLVLHGMLARHEPGGRLVEEERLRTERGCVYRLRFAIGGRPRSVVVKRLEPRVAQRNELVATRWLPAVELGDTGPGLLGVAAERSGRCVWHVYEDLGDGALDGHAPDRTRVRAAVELIARIHTRFAGHPLLPECRLHGGDLGIHFFATSVRDAITGLGSLPPPGADISPGHAALRDRLMQCLMDLLDQQSLRAQALTELGGPETLLHGDLWTSNTFVLDTSGGIQPRLIDWDHAAVGPFSYDLSTFLLRFPGADRAWIVEDYRAATARAGWRLPADGDLNLLFETAEYARCANRVIWPAIALARDGADWGYDMLAEVERWFIGMQPVLRTEEPTAGDSVTS